MEGDGGDHGLMHRPWLDATGNLRPCV